MSKTTASAERMYQIEAWMKDQKVKFGYVDSDDSGAILAELKNQPKADGLMFFVANVRDENYFSKLGKSFSNLLKRRTPQGEDCIAMRQASPEEIKESLSELNPKD